MLRISVCDRRPKALRSPLSLVRHNFNISSNNHSHSAWLCRVRFAPGRRAIRTARARWLFLSLLLCKNQRKGAGTSHLERISPDSRCTSKISRARDNDGSGNGRKNRKRSEGVHLGLAVVGVTYVPNDVIVISTASSGSSSPESPLQAGRHSKI